MKKYIYIIFTTQLCFNMIVPSHSCMKLQHSTNCQTTFNIIPVEPDVAAYNRPYFLDDMPVYHVPIIVNPSKVGGTDCLQLLQQTHVGRVAKSIKRLKCWNTALLIKSLQIISL